MAKKAATFAMSRADSSEKPAASSASKSAGPISCAFCETLNGKIQHRALPRVDVRLAVVVGQLVGEQRSLGHGAQDRTMRHDAVVTAILARCLYDDHLFVRLAQLVGRRHDNVMKDPKRLELGWPLCERAEDVGHEAEFVFNCFELILQLRLEVARVGRHAEP